MTNHERSKESQGRVGLRLRAADRLLIGPASEPARQELETRTETNAAPYQWDYENVFAISGFLSM